MSSTWRGWLSVHLSPSTASARAAAIVVRRAHMRTSALPLGAPAPVFSGVEGHGSRCPRSSGKVRTRLLVAFVLVIAIATAGLFAMMRKPGAAEPASASDTPKTTLLPLDEFLVNLADASSKHYLSVTITLEIAEPTSGKSEKPPKPPHGEGQAPDELTPRIRDAILEVLAQQTYSALRSKSGRTALKTAIKNNVNTKVKEIRVVNVLFSAFVMQ